MHKMNIPYFVSSLHPYPLRYRSVLLLFPTKLAFDDKCLVSSLQHTYRQVGTDVNCFLIANVVYELDTIHLLHGT